MRLFRRRAAFLRWVILALSPIGCVHSTEAAAHRACVPADGVQITVGTGYMPRIDWAPNCYVSTLAVAFGFNESSTDYQWAIGSSKSFAAADIGPGVIYGTTPAQAVETITPNPLAPGRTYLVFLLDYQGRQLAFAGFSR